MDNTLNCWLTVKNVILLLLTQIVNSLNFNSEKHVKAVFWERSVFPRTGEQGDIGLSPSVSVLTFDLLVIMGSTMLLTAESPPGF